MTFAYFVTLWLLTMSECTSSTFDVLESMSVLLSTCTSTRHNFVFCLFVTLLNTLVNMSPSNVFILLRFFCCAISLIYLVIIICDLCFFHSFSIIFISSLYVIFMFISSSVSFTGNMFQIVHHVKGSIAHLHIWIFGVINGEISVCFHFLHFIFGFV